ncbi:hypothetical protein Q7P37_004268 [Cladosporium fusiforme]
MTPSQRPANTGNANGILAEALEALRPDDRETVYALMPENASGIDAAFDEAYGRASELQQRCANKRWHCDYKGHRIFLSDYIDKVVQLLDKFKHVGDVLANVDSTYIGLPWAGIRAILEVATSDANKRAVLITGMELSLLMGNRLKVYMGWYARIPSTPASDNLRQALVNLYAHILGFLACAIRINQQGTTARLVQGLWNMNDLTLFEKQCDILCARAGEEARFCDSQIGEKWRDSLKEQLRSLDEIHDVHESLVRLHEKADLAKLIIAKGATYDSFADGGLARCLKGTRTALLDQSFEWANNPKGERVFWLCGKAGTGKSTIARTVAKKLQENGLLGASFFFKRGRADRSHANLLFPTIARQLADQFFEVGQTIASALDQDSLLCDKQLKPQFDKLLLEPLQAISRSNVPSVGVVLVIDALDECDSSDDIKTILLLLSRVEDITAIQIRIFVTSRPELPVELGFKQMSGDLHHDVRLEEAQEMSIAHDIGLFYQHRFAEIKEASSLIDDDLPDQWPGEESTRTLVNQAVPLFIFAFTVARYISADPKRNLATMVQQSRKKSLTGLKGTYLPILDQVVAPEGEDPEENRILDFKTVVGSIVLLFDPLSACALAHLLEIQTGDVGRVLRPLHSVLNIPRTADGKLDRTTPITMFHLSFRDFLVDPDLKDRNVFSIDAKETHRALGMHCIRLLQCESLKKDVCGIVQPGTRRSDVEKSVVHNSLPEAVSYACCYWVHHVTSGEQCVKDECAVHRFLEKHLLHWIEALSWLGKTSQIVPSLKALKSTVDVHCGRRFLAMLDDAIRFVLRNRYIIDEAPLQIYISALLFAPSRSITRETFGSVLQGYFEVMPQVHQRWGAEMQKLEGHSHYITTVALSHDNRTMVSGSWDKTIRVWDLATGEERQKLEGHGDHITAVAVSRDGKTVVSGSEDETMRVWDLTLGEEKQTLEARGYCITSVALSQDGEIVVSGSKDNTVRVWNLARGEEIRRFEGHSHCVTAVAISQDSKTLVSGSEDHTLRVWDLATGEQKHKLEGHQHHVTSVALSQDNSAVSGSWDNTIRVWDLGSGKERQKLEGHDGFVTAVAFSKEGRMVASGSRDQTVRLWDLATGQNHKLEGQKLEGHDDWVSSVALSQDCTMVVSGSEDKTIRLWDMTTAEREKLEGHDDFVTTVAFSWEGSVVASGSRDKTVRLWDLETDKKQKLEGHDDHVATIAFSHDDKILASGSTDKTIRLWDLATGKRRKLEGHDNFVTAIAFSHDCKAIASGSCDKTVRLWNLATGKHQVLPGHHGTITTVAISKDGSALASGSWDKTIRVWDSRTSKETRKYQLSRAVRNMAFSGNGSALDTDLGQLDIETGAITSQAQPTVSIKSSWVKRNGVDFLWLPHEFRGAYYDSYGSSLAIGQASGAVSFFKFN